MAAVGGPGAGWVIGKSTQGIKHSVCKIHTEKMQTWLAPLNSQTTQHLHDKRVRMIKISWFKTPLEKRGLRKQQLYISYWGSLIWASCYAGEPRDRHCNWKLTHSLLQKMIDNTPKLNITFKLFGNLYWLQSAIISISDFQMVGLNINIIGPAQHLCKWNRLEMEGQNRAGYSSVGLDTKMNGQIKMDRIQWMGLDWQKRKRKEIWKHTEKNNKDTLNILTMHMVAWVMVKTISEKHWFKS